MSAGQSLTMVVCALALAGCAAAPAHLRLLPEATGDARREVRAVASVRETEQVLASYLETWIAAPKTAAGKTAGGRFVRLWRKSGLPGDCKVGGWRVRFTGDWEAAYFDELLPA